MILRSISSFSRFASARFVLTVAFESVSPSFLVGHVTTSLLLILGAKWGERKCAPHLHAGRALFYKITSAPDSQTTQCRFNSCCRTLSRHLSELLTRLQRLISFRHNSSLNLPHHTSMFFNRLSILALAATSIAGGVSAQIQCQQDVLTCPDGTKYNRDPMNGVSVKSWDNVLLLAACVVFA